MVILWQSPNQTRRIHGHLTVVQCKPIDETERSLVTVGSGWLPFPLDRYFTKLLFNVRWLDAVGSCVTEQLR